MFNLNSILKKSKIAYIFVGIFLFLFVLPTNVRASDFKSFVYFTGIGCPHCAKVAPVLHEKINSSDGLLMLEYEVYTDLSNVQVMSDYGTALNRSFNSIPLVIYDATVSDAGDSPILNDFDTKIQSVTPNTLLVLGEQIEWNNLNLNTLKGKPKFFYKDRALVKTDSGTLTEAENEAIKTFLTTDDVEAYTSTLKGDNVSELSITDSGGKETYEKGLKINGWTLLWGKAEDTQATNSTTNIFSSIVKSVQSFFEKLKPSLPTVDTQWIKISFLAITDSINPCALSVLLMMLIAIATYHPKDRKQVLLSGLAFVLAVFVTYFIYGILIIKAFQFVQAITSIRLYLYKGLGVITLILAILEIKDFFFYKPGSIATEMPLIFRPKVQRILAKITSPVGAFGLGMFVTLFLLPCTMGPLFVASGILSSNTILAAFPYLLLYNFVFILPMIVIILLVFFGTKSVKQVSEWKEKNIRLIHLVIGLVFLLLGLSMLFGIF